jgi:hypothetical protein
MEDDIKRFWERANARIKELKTTQRVVSLNCGFTERRIESLVSLNRLPDAIEAVKIAQALETSVEYLVTGLSPILYDTFDILHKLDEVMDDIRLLSKIPEPDPGIFSKQKKHPCAKRSDAPDQAAKKGKK